MDLNNLQLVQSSLTFKTPPSKALASLLFINMGFGHTPWRLLNISTTIKNEKEGKKETDDGSMHPANICSVNLGTRVWRDRVTSQGR